MWALLPVEVDAAHTLPVDTGTAVVSLTGRQSVWLAAGTIRTETAMTRVDVTLSGAQAATVPAARVATAAGVGFPAATASNPSSGTDWWGWDPNSTATPPVLNGGGSAAVLGDASLPWHTNTGVWDPAELASLTVHSGNYTVSSGEVVEGLKITGDLIYTGASGFTVKRCWIVGEVNGSTGGGPNTGKFIHCDIGNSAGGQTHQNFKGNAHFYRCNVWGFIDGPSPWNSSGTVTIQDCFIHDLNWQAVPTSEQSSGFSHNDSIQPKQNGGTTLIKHNTFWCWMFNYSTQGGQATRSSGPNWFKTAAATASALGGHNQTSAVLIGLNYSSRVTNFDGNTFRGAGESYLTLRGNGGQFRNNTFSSTESEVGTAVLGTQSASHVSENINNRWWAGDTRSGLIPGSS